MNLYLKTFKNAQMRRVAINHGAALKSTPGTEIAAWSAAVAMQSGAQQGSRVRFVVAIELFEQDIQES